MISTDVGNVDAGIIVDEPKTVDHIGNVGNAAETSAFDSRLMIYARLLAGRYGLDADTALLILLATLAAAVGPSRLIANPLGGSLPGSLNLMLFDHENSGGLSAVRRAAAPLLWIEERHAKANRRKGPLKMRKERIEMEQRVSELRAAVQKYRLSAESVYHSKCGLPDTIERHPPTRAQIELEEAYESALVRLQEFGVEEKPWLVCNELSSKEIRHLASRCLDRSLFNFAPEGSAWNSLLQSGGSAQIEALRVLRAGFRGEPVPLEGETIARVVISNLWVIDKRHSENRGLNRIREDPFWDTFLFAEVRDLETDFDPKLLESTEDDEWWEDLILRAFKLRPCLESQQHVLSAESREAFVHFCNEQRREARGLSMDLQRFISRRPEQALKIALLFNIASEDPDEDEIEVCVLETAVKIAKRLGDTGLLSAAAVFAGPQVVLEVEVQKMVAKLRLHGPQRKRDLFRRYNSQDYSRLEPLLIRALETNQISTDGEFFVPIT